MNDIHQQQLKQVRESVYEENLQRIVKSKSTYNRKHKHKGCDIRSHLLTNDFY